MTVDRFVLALHRAAAVSALAALSWGCGSAPEPAAAPASTPARPEAIELTTDAQANAGIKVDTVRTASRTSGLTAPGHLALDETRTARIGSLQEALILETQVQVGDSVRVRQLLATMHGHALHDAWAGYRKAVAEHRRAESQLTYATETHERARRLYNDKALSLQELQRADVDRVAAVQEVEIAKAEILRSIEELEHVGVTVSASGEPSAAADSAEQIPVRSPINGIVLERLVTPGTTVIPGQPLFVVSDLSTLWAIAEVDEAQIARVRTGSRVEVTVAAYPGERFTGTITFVADSVNPETRRLTVRSTVPNTDRRLKPDMFATLTLAEGEPRPVVVVPADAVQSIDGKSVVFVEERAGRFVPRPVQVGSQVDNSLEITSGLTDGERIAVAGSFVLKSELLKETGEGN